VKITAATAGQGALDIKNTDANGIALHINGSGTYTDGLHIHGSMVTGQGVYVTGATPLTPAPALAADMTTLLNRLGAWTGSGVNTVLGAFKALLSKTASTPSDIGGTFDAATDSTEAIRDNMSAGTSLTAQEVRDAMKLAPTVGDPAPGSIDKHLDDIPTNPYTGTPPTADAIGTDAAAKILATPANKLATDASGRVTPDSVGGLTAQQTRDAMKLAPTTGAPATGSVDLHLDAIQARTDAFSALTVTVTSPVSTAGIIRIFGGDDYLIADARQIGFTLTGSPSISGGTVALRIGGALYAGVVTGAAACYFELTRTQTAALEQGGQLYTYELIATLSNEHVLTPVTGTLIVD
jgi:hypothetical protein